MAYLKTYFNRFAHNLVSDWPGGGSQDIHALFNLLETANQNKSIIHHWLPSSKHITFLPLKSSITGCVIPS